jgi:hypothetical protein
MTTTHPFPQNKNGKGPVPFAGTAEASKFDPPPHPGAWDIRQTVEVLSRPLPQSYLKTKRQGGQALTFIEWFTAVKVLDKYAPGWHWEVRQILEVGDRLVLTGRLTLPTSHGPVFREATGTEKLHKLTEEGERADLPYGEPVTNAEAQALKRAAAKFGLGLYLYDR